MATSSGLYSQDKDPVSGLTKNQRTVLDGLTKENKTQLQVAEELGISRQRVRQIVVDLQKKGYTIPGVKPVG